MDVSSSFFFFVHPSRRELYERKIGIPQLNYLNKSRPPRGAHRPVPKEILLKLIEKLTWRYEFVKVGGGETRDFPIAVNRTKRGL